MANSLTVASVIDKNRITSETAWIILLEISIIDPNTRDVTETLHIARNTEDVIFDGVTYVAGNFEVQVDQRQGSAPTASVVAQDQTGYIHNRMELMAGGVMSEVRMIVVNSARLDKPAELSENFQIINSSVKSGVVTFELGSENPLGIRFPKHRQFQDRCAWRFKGYGCGYAGAAATCDYTKDGPNGCAAKSNTLNFRGLPGLVRLKN